MDRRDKEPVAPLALFLCSIQSYRASKRGTLQYLADPQYLQSVVFLMSFVTNIVIYCVPGDAAITELQKFFVAEGLPQLRECGDAAGGNRCLEADLWAGAYNYFDQQHVFLQHALGVSWEFPGEVLLIIKEENAEIETHLIEPEPEPKPCTRNHPGPFNVRRQLERQSEAPKADGERQ
jgi:hypothetical protein